jgi:hypothetical protein
MGYSALNSSDTYELPPRKVTIRGRDFTTLQGKTQSGEERVMFKREAE